MKLLPLSILRAADKKDGTGNGGGNASSAAKSVTVKVVCAALSEDGQTYAKGETLQTTEERAAALGPDHVTVV